LCNAEFQEQPIKTGFHSSWRHFELLGDFTIVTALQQQIDDLLIARPNSNSQFLHRTTFLQVFWSVRHQLQGSVQKV
jgi:hypothetical protein